MGERLINHCVVHTGGTVAADTAILDDLADYSAITPIKKVSELKITVSMSAAGKFSIRITRGGNTEAMLLNNDTNLEADASYKFTHPVAEGDTIDFSHSAQADVNRLQVDEITAEA